MSVRISFIVDSTRTRWDIRIGDSIDIPDMKIQIILTQPSLEEQEEYVQEKLEKERVAKLVKEMKQLHKRLRNCKSQFCITR